jgi:hypothetical protein
MRTSRQLVILSVVAFAISVAAGYFLAAGYFFADSLCTEDSKLSVPSGDGMYVATIVERNCGATGSYNLIVRLLPGPKASVIRRARLAISRNVFGQ